MEKQKRWQFFLIVAVIVLTLFNILPTVFYYMNPLKKPIGEERAEDISLEIIQRVNSLEDQSRQWLISFSKNLGIQPEAVTLKEDDPGIFEVKFKNIHHANLFRRFLPPAGNLIAFVPAQLDLYAGESQDPTEVLVARQIDVHLDPADVNNIFHFYTKYQGSDISERYREAVYDRAANLAVSFAGTSQVAKQIESVIDNVQDPQFNDLTVAVAKEIANVSNTFGQDNPITERYLLTLTQTDNADKDIVIQKFLAAIENVKSSIEGQRKPMLEEKVKLQEEGKFLDNAVLQRLSTLESETAALKQAGEIIKEKTSLIAKGATPLTEKQALESLKISEAKIDPKDPQQHLSLEGSNPFIESLVIDWGNDMILLNFYEDVQSKREGPEGSEQETLVKERLNQLIINQIARASRLTDETIIPEGNDFAVALSKLTNPESFLAFDLGFVAKKQGEQILTQLQQGWRPDHSDLLRENYPLMSYDDYKQLSPQENRLGLVVYSPSLYDEEPPEGFRDTSIYVIARGLDAIIQKYRDTPDAPGAKSLNQGIEALSKMLREKGFIAYSGSSYGIDDAFNRDYIFELSDHYTMLLNATREDFYVKGSKRYATLDFTDVEQRIITLNNIQDRIQEDLVKWRDEYNGAQVDLDVTKKYLVPPPTKNIYFENLKLSLAKYFRGDDRKILKWGLDLSGGKTVRIGIQDQNMRQVTNPEDLNQTVNELYKRINNMGVAERTIRIENNNIILDFPGSQAFSASELIKSSAMYFHIVNEKFSPLNSNLKDTVNEFLQNVWNEAVVTNRKSAQSINEIAFEHLGGNLDTGEYTQQRTEAAKILFDNGLRLANPRDAARSPEFNDTLSLVAVLRGEDFSEWEGQTHPLLFVFHNYALEGASLTDIRTGYDPSQGNILSFSIKRSYEGTEKGSGNPRVDFYTWTSQFSEDKIAGTPKEAYSHGRGWRMAVILNETVITMPSLRAALRDAAQISGRFTQREITQLAADLKAGSLSFTPKILSEQNVSAELGKEERTKGIIASLIGLLSVAVLMIGYYRFAGLVATCAVLFNLLIMWGILQNLGAALTLPGIAGIVLTIGMAVDANVLVFERIREEFKISGRIASAIQAGYRKAFSAIVDSNITTIMAALILIQFDSGPIKGFAVTLIIGLISSMFTSLFMTRYFFAGWVQNPKHKELKMAQLIKETKIDFLGYAKPAIVISLIIMVCGGYLFYTQKNTLFGMDFTGGYSLTVELEEAPGVEINFREKAINAFLAHGATSTDFEIRELTKPNQLRIQMGLGMEEAGHPFHMLPETYDAGEFDYDFERDPRIVWVVNTLGEAGLKVQESELVNLDQQWSMMSGQFSDAMRNNAIMALGAALISILIYITLRFEFKFAISAVIALAHDVLITLGILALFRSIGMPVQIDLEVVGAIMTIIGYSLNDTIIVFDRIREDIKLLRKLKFPEIINHALNVTLSRTIMTSGTTLLVLLSLVFLGGRSIFDFSLVMTIGVVVGTISSLFIASPVLLFFHNREAGSEVALKKA